MWGHPDQQAGGRDERDRIDGLNRALQETVADRDRLYEENVKLRGGPPMAEIAKRIARAEERHDAAGNYTPNSEEATHQLWLAVDDLIQVAREQASRIEALEGRCEVTRGSASTRA